MEREILASARHPYVVPLHYSFQSEKHLYLVLEYCAGGEFFRVLQRQPNHRIDEDTARFYVAEVILALEYLHLMGYVYRDLKPENILLHANGHAMLSDFDLSKRCFPRRVPPLVKSMFHFFNRHVKGVDTRVCANDLRSSSFVGTEEYLSPEILRGQAHTSSLDWWTVGILLYEMVYGVTPFKGSDRYSTYHHILENEVLFPESPPLSDFCRDLIQKLLIKDSYKRLGSTHGAIDIKAHDFFRNINWACKSIFYFGESSSTVF
jgi:protein-serine/threonine kinase